MVQCNYWNVNYIKFQWFTIGLFSKYTKNVNILKYISKCLILKKLTPQKIPVKNDIPQKNSRPNCHTLKNSWKSTKPQKIVNSKILTQKQIALAYVKAKSQSTLPLHLALHVDFKCQTCQEKRGGMHFASTYNCCKSDRCENKTEVVMSSSSSLLFVGLS